MTGWHATSELLARFATAPASIDGVTAVSLEAHLLDCNQCRRAVAAAAEPAAVDAGWDAIADRIDRPRPTLAERLLVRLLPTHVTRVVAATPALRLSWLLAFTVVVAAVVLVGRQAGTDAPFLVLAPLVPLAGVAVSFGPAPDPAGETAVATPLYGAALLLLRTAAVLATSMVVLGAGALSLPGLEWRDAGWILPAVALTFGALALSTWVAPFTATACATIGWVVLVEAVLIVDDLHRGVAAGPLFGPLGQAAFAGTIVAAAAVIALRRPHLVTLEARR